MPHILHRQIGHDYPVAGRGEGVHIYEDIGKQYFDATGGGAVSCLGHARPDVIAAMKTQLDKIEFAHTSSFTTPALEDLATDLAARLDVRRQNHRDDGALRQLGVEIRSGCGRRAHRRSGGLGPTQPLRAGDTGIAGAGRHRAAAGAAARTSSHRPLNRRPSG